MEAPLDCLAGMYCPVEALPSTKAVSIDGVPCPPGTYMSVTLSKNGAGVLDNGVAK
jgi:hypothetical protein